MRLSKGSELDEVKEISTLSFGLAFFKIGLTAYGMAILQQIKALIIGNKWLTREQVDEGIAMVQFIPDPSCIILLHIVHTVSKVLPVLC